MKTHSIPRSCYGYILIAKIIELNRSETFSSKNRLKLKGGDTRDSFVGVGGIPKQ